MSAPRYPRVDEEDFSLPSLNKIILNASDAPRRFTPVLLPCGILQPWVLALVWAVPQCVLLAINLQAWDLASGEVNQNERTAAQIILAMELISLGLGAGLCLWLWRGKKLFQRRLGFFPLAASSLYLATAFLLAERAVPDTLAEWMLPHDQWILKQFALVMPAALFGAIRVLCPNREGNEDYAARFGLSLGLAIGLLLLCFPFFIVTMSIASVIDPGFTGPLQILAVAGYLGFSTFAAAAVLRICLSVYVRMRATSPKGLAFLTMLVALLGPMAGLLLNAGIPFPANFQTPGVYVLTVVTAVFLLLPNFSHPHLHRAVWLGQCALFPFSVYFFAVFLPFLPLTPLATMFFGLGLLMYVPSLLFLLHGFRILDGFRAEIRGGGKLMPAVLGLTAIMAGPAACTIQARWDRANLNEALDYLQYPDYAQTAKFHGSLDALHSSLIHLRDFKEGNYLPYLSEYYNWLAFDNLTLPQERLNSLATTFFGEPLPKGGASGMDFMRGTSRRRTVTEVMGGRDGPRPTMDAVAKSITTSTRIGQGVARTSAVITITNPTATTTEYQTLITLPPGVMISNMWLTIGTERVPGKIFEKRAAIWVYQKITEARPVPRDPAILRYIGPNVAELRVYPVETNAPRVVEVEFLYPDGAHGRALIGRGDIPLHSTRPPTASVGVAPDGNIAAFIPEAASLPSVSRQPYLHFLVDASKDSAFGNAEVLRQTLREGAARFPGVGSARLSFVNFETQQFEGGKIVPLDELLALSADKFRPERFQGGFLGHRAMKEALWQQHLALAKSPGAAKQFPHLVLVPSPGAALDDTAGNLTEFARLLPDNPGFWILGQESSSIIPFDPQTPAGTNQPIRILRIGGQVFAAPAAGAVSYVSVEPAKGPREIEALDPSTGQFLPAIKDPVSAPEYARAAAPWAVELGRIFEPFTHRKDALDAVLKLCRETGVLVPSAAYMVVENTAQWKMLERTERKTMKGNEAMEVSETVVTPEPGTVMLVLIGLAALYFAHNTRRRAPQT